QHAPDHGGGASSGSGRRQPPGAICSTGHPAHHRRHIMRRKILRSTGCGRSGFTLLELLVVMVILTAVLGVVFSAVTRLQKTYKTEETKVDATALARTFLDGMASELRQAGFPRAAFSLPGCSAARR